MSETLPLEHIASQKKQNICSCCEESRNIKKNIHTSFHGDPQNVLEFLLHEVLQEKQWNTALKIQEVLLKLKNKPKKSFLFQDIKHAEYILEELEKFFPSD